MGSPGTTLLLQPLPWMSFWRKYNFSLVSDRMQFPFSLACPSGSGDSALQKTSFVDPFLLLGVANGPHLSTPAQHIISDRSRQNPHPLRDYLISLWVDIKALTEDCYGSFASWNWPSQWGNDEIGMGRAGRRQDFDSCNFYLAGCLARSVTDVLSTSSQGEWHSKGKVLSSFFSFFFLF